MDTRITGHNGHQQIAKIYYSDSGKFVARSRRIVLLDISTIYAPTWQHGYQNAQSERQDTGTMFGLLQQRGELAGKAHKSPIYFTS
jgi:hypothetical protein